MAESIECRRCNVLSEKVSVKGHPDRIRCPVCGINADLDVAIEAAGRHVSQDILKDLQNQLIRSTRGSKHVTYTPGRVAAGCPPDFIFR